MNNQSNYLDRKRTVSSGDNYASLLLGNFQLWRADVDN